MSGPESKKKPRQRSVDTGPAPDGFSKETIKHEDGSIPTVFVRGQSFRAMGLQHQHIDAAERFSRDWESAFSALRCRGFEPGVDGSKEHRAHLLQVESQRRLRAVREHLGERNWVIVKAVVAYGASQRTIHRHGAEHERRLISVDVEVAFSALAEFYSGQSRSRDKNWQAFEKFIREFELGNVNEAHKIWEQGVKTKKSPAISAQRAVELPASAVRLIQDAFDRLDDWAKLNKKTIKAFQLAASGKGRAITAHAISSDGSGLVDRTIIVKGPYLLEAIDFQVLKLAEERGWKEINSQ